MEMSFILIVMVGMTLVHGSRYKRLELKVSAMEMSLIQDIAMLRKTQTAMDKKLEEILKLMKPSLQEDITDKPTLKTDDNEHFEQISTETDRMKMEIKRLKRAFVDFKQNLRSEEETNAAESYNCMPTTQEILNDTLKQIVQNVQTMTSEVNDNFKNLKVNKDILSSVKSFEVNYYGFVLAEDDSLSDQAKKGIFERLALLYLETNCLVEFDTCSKLNKLLSNLKGNSMDCFLDKYKMEKIEKLVTNYGSVRLGNYSTYFGKTSITVKGRVEVYYNDTWGTVCNDDFVKSKNGAEVVCRQLRLTGGKPIANNAPGINLFKFFTVDSSKLASTPVNPIWLDDVQCTGTESSIFQCPRHDNVPIGEHNCDHSEDADIECTIPDNVL